MVLVTCLLPREEGSAFTHQGLRGHMVVALWRDEMSPLVSWRSRETIGTSLPIFQLGWRCCSEIKSIRTNASSPETSMALVTRGTHHAGAVRDDNVALILT